MLKGPTHALDNWLKVTYTHTVILRGFKTPLHVLDSILRVVNTVKCRRWIKIFFISETAWDNFFKIYCWRDGVLINFS